MVALVFIELLEIHVHQCRGILSVARAELLLAIVPATVSSVVAVRRGVSHGGRRSGSARVRVGYLSKYRQGQ